MKVILDLLKGFAKLIVKTLLGANGNEFIKFMQAEIAIIMDSDLTGDEKRKEIQRKARAWLKERGLEISGSLINLIIEVYYNFLKGQDKADPDDDD